MAELKEVDLTNDELIEWSRAIADACMRTAIKPEEVETACAAYMQAKEGKQTNYKKFFGTPERAAKTIDRIIDMHGMDGGCGSCPVNGACDNAEMLAEWMKEESE